MTDEKLLRGRMLLSRAEETPEGSHLIRIRMADKAREAVEAFIAEEVLRAVSHPMQSPLRMSWAEVAAALELSKSAVYIRYGKGKSNGGR